MGELEPNRQPQPWALTPSSPFDKVRALRLGPPRALTAPSASLTRRTQVAVSDRFQQLSAQRALPSVACGLPHRALHAERNLNGRMIGLLSWLASQRIVTYLVLCPALPSPDQLDGGKPSEKRGPSKTTAPGS